MKKYLTILLFLFSSLLFAQPLNLKLGEPFAESLKKLNNDTVAYARIRIAHMGSLSYDYAIAEVVPVERNKKLAAIIFTINQKHIEQLGYGGNLSILYDFIKQDLGFRCNSILEESYGYTRFNFGKYNVNLELNEGSVGIVYTIKNFL